MTEQGNRTVAQVLGEITWLLSQTASHRHLTLADLEWAVMPAILLNQFHVFYKDKQPVAVALWALLSEENEKLLTAQVRAAQTARLETAAWRSGDRLWLMDLVSPFATPENTLYETLTADIASTLFQGQRLNILRLDTEVHAQRLSSLDPMEMASA